MVQVKKNGKIRTKHFQNWKLSVGLLPSWIICSTKDPLLSTCPFHKIFHPFLKIYFYFLHSQLSNQFVFFYYRWYNQFIENVSLKSRCVKWERSFTNKFIQFFCCDIYGHDGDFIKALTTVLNMTNFTNRTCLQQV